MVIARRLEKTILRAPVDGVVSVIFAEVGEAVRAGQPVLAIEESASSGCRSTRGKICCTASCWERRSRSRGRAGAKRRRPRHRAAADRLVRDLAGRASGRRSRSQRARLRLHPQGDATAFEPGMTVWLLR
jgi:HlyD family secretion protein